MYSAFTYFQEYVCSKIAYLFVGLIQMYQNEPFVAVLYMNSIIIYLFLPMNHIGRLIVSVLISSAVDRGVYGLRSSQAKAYTIGMYPFSAKHPALSSKEQQLVGSE